MKLWDAALLARALGRRVRVYLVDDPDRLLAGRESAVIEVTSPIKGAVAFQVGLNPSWQWLSREQAERVLVW